MAKADNIAFCDLEAPAERLLAARARIMSTQTRATRCALMKFWSDYIDADRIVCGDALEFLKSLSDESVNLCVTSPPYYGLRDYGVEG